MQLETGISMYFWDSRISIRKKALQVLGNPSFIHLMINEKEKQLFIQRCEQRDNDTFQINYLDDSGDIEYYYINAKNLMRYLAMLIGVPYPSNSLRFGGRVLDDGMTIYVDLKEYQEIPYEDKKIET